MMPPSKLPIILISLLDGISVTSRYGSAEDMEPFLERMDLEIASTQFFGEWIVVVARKIGSERCGAE